MNDPDINVEIYRLHVLLRDIHPPVWRQRAFRPTDRRLPICPRTGLDMIPREAGLPPTRQGTFHRAERKVCNAECQQDIIARHYT
jgi:hypothetical protein